MTGPAAGARDASAPRYLGRVTPILGPEAAVAERQVPFVALFVVALACLLLPEIAAPMPGIVDAAVVVVAASVLAAVLVPWARLPEAAQDVLPVLQVVAVALLRAGTGGSGSIFTSMVFLPVVTLASQRGRRGVVIVALSVAAVILAPVVLDADAQLTSDVLVRGAFVALVAVVIALAVHGVTNRLRARTEAVDAMRENEQRLLARSRADAMELARVAANRKTVRDQLVSVIDSATEQAIVATDPDGLVEVFNAGAERMLGYAEGEVVGRMQITDLALPEDVERRSSGSAQTDLQIFLEDVAAGRAAIRDWTVVRADGGHVTARLAVTRRHDVDGRVVGYVVVASDVTAEREAERLKDQFVSLVSHELRTPLTSVLGYLELLQDGSGPLTDEQREYLGVIERNARRQLRLVGDLLLAAQVDAGTFAVSPGPADLADVARASAAVAAPAAETAGVSLELDAEPTPLQGDVGRLGQAVDNLLSNAVKFTAAGGSVRIRVRPGPDGGGELSVSDTGIGIPPDELASLTQRFYRATTATRRAIPGIGLGLSIAQAVVDAHHGTLTVDSAVGVGTTFTMRIPGL